MLQKHYKIRKETLKMKRRTWKNAVAALILGVTLVSSPFHAFALEEEVQGSGVTEVTDIEGAADETGSTDATVSETDIKSAVTSASVTKKVTVNKKKASKRSYTKAELRLMSCIISCEAIGEPYAGKLAVGIVVMNRLRSSKFPNTVKGVIYERNQFSPAGNGILSKTLAKYDSGKFTSKYQKDCIKAAKKALSGTTTVTYNNKTINMKSYLFFSVYLRGSRLKIGHHNFK
jgi:spore germination cell wall hydrolase CwlJ-like protein